MGVVIRQSIKATVVSYVGFALGYVSVLLLFPFYFTPEEFGLTRILLAVASIVVQFAHLGIANITVQFFPHFRDDHKKRGSFFSLAIAGSCIGFFLSALVLIIFKSKILSSYQDQSPLFVEYYYYVLPIAFCILITAVFEAFARARFRIAVPALIKDVILRLIIILFIYAYFLKLVTFSGFVKLFVLAYIIPVILELIYLKKLNLLNFNFDFKFLEKKLFRHMLSFGIFTMLVGSATIVVGNLDVLMLSSFLGLSATAIYSVGFYIGSVIEIPTRALSSIVTPIVVQAWKNNDSKEIADIYKKSALNQAIFGGLLFIGIWANVDNLFKFLPPGYAEGKWVIFFIAISKLIDMFTGVNSEIIMASKYYRFNFYVMLMLIALTVITNYILIPHYGLIGAAVAAAISMFVFNCVKCIFLWIKFRIHPFSKSTIYVLIIPTITFFICSFIPAQVNFILDIIIRSIAITVLFSGLIIGLKVSEDINKTFKAAISRRAK